MLGCRRRRASNRVPVERTVVMLSDEMLEPAVKPLTVRFVVVSMSLCRLTSTSRPK